MEDTLIVDLYKMELERIKYLLKSYFRIRLAKIESQLFYLIKERDSPDVQLSKEEWKYVLTLCSMRGQFYRENFTRMLPSICREFEKDKPIPEAMALPPSESYIFVRIVRNAGICQFPGEYSYELTSV